MSDETNQNRDGQKADSEQSEKFTNLKAELDRKLGNTETQLDELKKVNEQLLTQISTINQSQQQQATKVQATEESDLKDLIYDNPQKYAEIIEKRAEDKVMAKVDARNVAQQKQAGVLAKLTASYPEISDPNNDLTKKAVAIYSTMPPEEQVNPLAYQVAVGEAAAELSVKPFAKREKKDQDSFSMAPGPGSNARSRQTEQFNDEAMFKVAEMFGMDTKDEKVQERLKKRATRKTWNKYQEIKDD